LFKDSSNQTYPLGDFTVNALRFVEPGSLIKFTSPDTKTFMPNGTWNETGTIKKGQSTYKWAKVIAVSNTGVDVEDDGTGPVILNDIIPDGALISQVIPNYSKSLVDDLKTEIIDQTFEYKDFALRYDITDRIWKIVLAEDINTISDFATGKAGDTTGENLDSSWMLYFKTDGEKYTITYRQLRYVFESADEIRFFFDSADKIYDPSTGQVVRDRIDVLNINTQPGQLTPFTKDFTWTITDAYKDSEGYLDSRKIQVQFIDLDDDGVVDDPDIFEQIVGEEDTSISTEEKIIFQKKYTTTDGVEDFKYLDNSTSEVVLVQNESSIAPYTQWDNNGQIFYLIDEGVFKKLNKTLNNTTLDVNYKAYYGRAGLKLHYVHVADSGYRIDPSASNIIDTYILSKTYDDQVKQYIDGTLSVKPKPPSNDELFRSYGSSINEIKSISDEIIYHPVKYKILFGDKAPADLQVKFKIVKNPNLVINDNELKSDIIESINRFFDIENWDFGETFYFQELSSYIMSQLSPKLVSILIVPRQTTQSFGSLFEIKSEADEIFASGAKVSDIETIDEITATNLQASGNVITSSTSTTSNQITSSASSTSSSTGGGYSY